MKREKNIEEWNKPRIITMLFICMTCFICLQIVYNIIDYCRMVRNSSYVLYDFKLRWQECAYVLHGINPFDSISGGAIIDSIGKIDSVAGTMPWAYFIGNAMVAGWMDYEQAAVYYNLFYLISGILCLLMVICEYQKVQTDKRWGALGVCSIISFWAIVYALLLGNYGTTCCFLGIISIILSRKGKMGRVIAGALLAITLCKPQTGGLLFLTYVMVGEFLVAGVSVVIVLLSYLAVSLLTNTSVITLISQIFQQGTGYDDILINDGVFTFLRNLNVPTIAILLLSMITGITLCFYLFTRIRKSNMSDNLFLVFTPAALCSCIWFYHNPYDTEILVVPILVISLLISNEMDIKNIVALLFSWVFLISGYLICEKYSFAVLRRIGVGDYIAHDVSILIEDVLYILIGFVIMWMVERIKTGD